MCAHMMQDMKVCELPARTQDQTNDIMKQLAFLCDKRNEYGGKFSL